MVFIFGLKLCVQKLLSCKCCSFLEGVGGADETVICLPGDEFFKVVEPGVGDCRTIGNNEHHACVHFAHEVIACQCFAKARFGVPQEFCFFSFAGLQAFFVVGVCCVYCLLLFAAQDVGKLILSLYVRIAAGSKFPQQLLGRRTIDIKPFGVRLTLDVFKAFQIVMEIVVCKIFTAAVRIACFLLPFYVKAHVRGFCLLFDTLFDGRLLGVANLRPTVMTGDFGSGIGVDFWDYVCVGVDVDLHSHLRHLLYMSFDKVYFFVRQTILFVKLQVNFMNGF